MGFFKRFFSLGSKKSKRRQQARHEECVEASSRGLQAGEPWKQEDKEAMRLLRSSSAQFSAASQVDYAPLPPLPAKSATHTPAPTTARTEGSTQRYGSYTVKVLERKLESRTEFPNANPPLNTHEELDDLQDSPLAKCANPRRIPITPRDKNRLLRLRQDPSVASLLNMYDENGRISSTAFSNTPPYSDPFDEVPGRQPVKRSGSTLRQLLGGSELEEHAAEGDISWAERYLGEHAGSTDSLASTAPLETPKDTLSHHDPSPVKPSLPDFTFSSDVSKDASANYPFISSMEVEVNESTDRDLPSVVEESRLEEPPTPKRAAEVFGFLPHRRKSVLERQRSQSPHSVHAPSVPPKDDIPPLPPLPMPKLTVAVPDTSDSSMILPAQIHTATITNLKLIPVLNPLSRSTDTLNLLYTTQSPVSSPLMERSTSPNIPQVKARVHLTGDSQLTGVSGASLSSKMLRGPRPQPSNASKAHTETFAEPKLSDTHHLMHGRAICDTTTELPTPAPTPAHRPRIPKASHDPHNPTARTRQHKRRITSQAPSVGSQEGGGNSTRVLHAKKQPRKGSREAKDKENTPPKAPLRTIFDKRHPNLVHGEPSSPASSSELSPLAKEMMTSLRKQRMRARDEMRHQRSISKQHNRRLSAGK